MSANASQAASETLRVAIIGAGIGGLTLSTALGRLAKDRNLEVDIYEGAAEISEVGAGIGIWPRGWKMMQALGLEEQLLKFVDKIDEDLPSLVWRVRKSDQKEGVNVSDLFIKGGSYGFHRADIQQVLMSHTMGRLHLKRRLASFEETADEVRLQFQDGSSATCDILIGMDGIKSVVRRGLLVNQDLATSPSMDPVWSGTVVYRGLVDAKKLEAVYPGHQAINMPMLYAGKLKHLIVYPVNHEKRLVNIAAFATDPSKEGTIYPGSSHDDCDIEEILDVYREFEPEVKALLRCMEHPFKWPINHLIPLERYAYGRVLVAGDAAHAMPPHEGAGAGSSMEDAYILANLLSHPLTAKQNIKKVAEIYSANRTPEGNRVLSGSIGAGKLSDLVGPGFEDVKEGDDNVSLEALKEHFQALAKYWDWVWKETAEEGKRQAIAILEGSQ